MQSRSTHFTTCNLCEAMCGLSVTVEGGRVSDIRGDRDDGFSRGHICPKPLRCAKPTKIPTGIRQPLRRTPSGFVPVGWDEALAEIADRLDSIRRRDGRNAVAVYAGNPTVHNLHALLGYAGFLRALGTKIALTQTPRMQTAASDQPAFVRRADGDSSSRCRPHRFYVDAGCQSGSFRRHDVARRCQTPHPRHPRARRQAGPYRPRRSETSGNGRANTTSSVRGDAALLLPCCTSCLPNSAYTFADVRKRAHGIEQIERLVRDFPPLLSKPPSVSRRTPLPGWRGTLPPRATPSPTVESAPVSKSLARSQTG